jgi:hypothetical protein
MTSCSGKERFHTIKSNAVYRDEQNLGSPRFLDGLGAVHIH